MACPVGGPLVVAHVAAGAELAGGQRDLERESHGDSGAADRALHNHVRATDTLQFDANFNVTGHSGSQTTQTYRAVDFGGACYSRSLTAIAQVLTAVQDGHGWEGFDQGH